MRNKLLRTLLAVAIAIGVWTYVVTVVSPNSDKYYYDIPVVTQSERLLHERGLMITDTVTDFVDLQLEGSRLDLNKLNSSNITVTVDVSKIDKPGTHSLPYDIAYPGDVASNAFVVLSKMPDTVTVEVEERISKDVPVEVDFTGELLEIYTKKQPELDKEKINIIGPKSVIDRITTARIQVDLEGRNESILNEQMIYTLCDKDKQPVDAKLVTTNAKDVELTLKIMRRKVIDLVVEVINGGGATADNTQIIPSIMQIEVRGSEKALEGLEKWTVGTIDLSTIVEDTVKVFPIELPEGIENATGDSEVSVEIKLPELETKTLIVKRFKAINTPEGMTVEWVTKTLEVQIRGPKGQIENLTADDLIVTVDFTGVSAGTEELKVAISSSVAPDVGAIGQPMVTATLRED